MSVLPLLIISISQIWALIGHGRNGDPRKTPWLTFWKAQFEYSNSSTISRYLNKNLTNFKYYCGMGTSRTHLFQYTALQFQLWNFDIFLFNFMFIFCVISVYCRREKGGGRWQSNCQTIKSSYFFLSEKRYPANFLHRQGTATGWWPICFSILQYFFGLVCQ
jgi:hypothetical protein